ncbi:MAG: sigma-70 family RNA polymerase sigma factor [Planctomycetota bacterium]|nr:sigma-70 family RNA polymerase sigma factor [Planctomycetota bacterium]MDI6788178.1 sigma-70 family RNA polymerase sigma factor [Planctomycetota bacterium]
MPDDNLNNLEDEDLITAYRTDDKAREVLVKRYYGRLWKFAYKRSRYKDRGFIDDIIQEVFLRADQQLLAGGFTPAGPGSVKSWLFAICHNTLMEENREHSKHPRPVSEVFPEGLPDDLQMKRPEPDSEPESAYRLDRLNECLNQLSPPDRKLFNLYKDNRPYKEIQQEPEFQGYSLDNLRRKVCDIRESLKECLKRRTQNESGM